MPNNKKKTFEGPVSLTGIGPRDVLESLISKIDLCIETFLVILFFEFLG